MQTNDDACVTVTEACAALQIAAAEADLLMCGPFAPSAAGLLHIRQVLGAAVVLALPMLAGEVAVSIALTACKEASTAGTPRLLAVGWNTTGPAGCWLSDGLPSDIHHALLTVPADHMLAELTARLGNHRAAAQAPN